MKLRTKIIIGVIIAMAAIVYIAVLAKSENTTENRTELVSSTSKTTDSKATETSDRTSEEYKNESSSKDQNSNKDGSSSSQTSAKLIDFNLDTFKKTSGTRILLFHDKSNENSKKVYSLIKNNLSKFSKKATFFSIKYSKDGELVKYHNVQKPGTLISFTKEGEITGIYIPDSLSVESIKKSLGV